MITYNPYHWEIKKNTNKTISCEEKVPNTAKIDDILNELDELCDDFRKLSEIQHEIFVLAEMLKQMHYRQEIIDMLWDEWHEIDRERDVIFRKIGSSSDSL